MGKNAAVNPFAYPPRECAVCGATFTPTRRNQAVCSDECAYYRRLERTRANNAIRRGDLGAGSCVICGASFQKNRINEKCCGPACYGLWAKIKSRDWHAATRAGLTRERVARNIARLKERVAELNKKLADMEELYAMLAENEDGQNNAESENE